MTRNPTLAIIVSAMFAIACMMTGCGTSPPTAREDAPSATETPPANKDTKPAETKRAQPRKITAAAFREAALNGRYDVVKEAIEMGADVNSYDVADSLRALHLAAYNGHSETVELLLEHGAEVDCRDFEGKTPLTHACTGPFEKTVKILIEAGADINARESTEGFTPLMMAAALGQTEVVKVLLRNDVDKSLRDNDNDSAQDHARNGGHSHIVELLEGS